ncbi:MAG TPA: isoprenylcysteine carboxylmethyltransferase family protein [Bacteroidales bacterium]
MKKLLVPPVFVLLTLILTVTFYFCCPKFNVIDFPYNLAGLLSVALGFAIMSKTWDLFKKHNTTLEIKPSSAMITEGVFAKSRNPMYIGMFLLLLGFGICSTNMLSILACFVFVLLVNGLVIPQEEKLMKEAFGQEYDAYKSKVRRWI